jgi:hypothetical protein
MEQIEKHYKYSHHWNFISIHYNAHVIKIEQIPNTQIEVPIHSFEPNVTHTKRLCWALYENNVLILLILIVSINLLIISLNY